MAAVSHFSTIIAPARAASKKIIRARLVRSALDGNWPRSRSRRVVQFGRWSVKKTKSVYPLTVRTSITVYTAASYTRL